MPHFFAPLISNLQMILEQGGYAVLSIITILEGVPVIGSLVPGHTAVILSGFFAKLNILNINIVIPTVIISAMLGDYSGYLIGKKYGLDFLKRFGKFLFIKEEYINKAKDIINTHTGKAIIFGRFNPLTRPLVPFIIGSSNVHIKRFWIFDFIGVSIWALGSIALGYIFGASYHLAAKFFGKFIFIAICISILIIWAYNFINKRFHIFAKYELIVLILNIVGLYGFFKTVQDALRDRAFMAELDAWINIFFTTHANSSSLVFMNLISDIFSPIVLYTATILFTIYFLLKKKWRYATISFFSMSGGLILGAFIKEIIQRTRPISAFIIENDYSFPSWHAIAVTVFFTLTIYFFAREFKNIVWREIFISFSVFIIILTCISRLYLGVHWMSDVIAGSAFGLFWTTLMILGVRYIGLIVKSLLNK